MPITVDRTRQRLRAGTMALGFGVHHLRSVAAPMLAAATGHDWLFIDGEHAAFTIQEMTQLCIAALPTGVTPIVRVAVGALDEATRALDDAAMGIVVPHLDTAADARRIGHSKVVEAYRTVGDACRRHGKVLAMGAVYPEADAACYVAMQAGFLLTSSDHDTIVAGAAQRAALFNGLPGAPI